MEDINAAAEAIEATALAAPAATTPLIEMPDAATAPTDAVAAAVEAPAPMTEAAAPAAPIAPTAPAPPPPVTILSSFQLKSQDGTVTFKVRPGQNPALNAPDKRSKGEVPKDWTCTACGFESTSYDGARVHR